MLVHLEECGHVKNLGEAVGQLVAHTDEVRLDQAVEMALAMVALPALVVLSFFEALAWSACSTAAELSMSINTVASQLSLVPMTSWRWPRRLRRK
eukprot:5295551-Pleurochrysis_carterae.AAC.1